jgi:hypothetical protein
MSVGRDKEVDSTSVIINEVQLLLAEKRTTLASMRTGIAVFALPLSVLSVLISASKCYDVLQVIHLPVPLLVLCAGVVFWVHTSSFGPSIGLATMIDLSLNSSENTLRLPGL